MKDGETSVSKVTAAPKSKLTFDQANTLCNNYLAGHSEVSAHLIYGIEWDTMLKFIETETTEYGTSIDYGNYSGTLKVNEVVTLDEQKNIYNVSGNLREWTQEIYNGNTEYRVFRGGYYNYDKFPAGYRNYDKKETSDKYIGYRIAFYIK